MSYIFDDASDRHDDEPQGPLWRLPEWFPDLSEDVQAKLRKYYDILIQFNSRMNLISPRSENEADLIHFSDSIIASQSIMSESEQPTEIFDLGSGNGFPGLVFAILYPSVKVIGVDSDARKIEFLRHCAFDVGIPNFQAVHARVEDLEPNSIHFAISRGFASITKSLMFTRKSAAIDCQYFHFKSRSWAKEVAEIPSQLIAHWEPLHVKDYRLPEGEFELSLVVTRRRK